MDENFDLTVATHQHAGEFLEQCGEFLSQTDDINNGVLSAAELLRHGSDIYQGAFWLGSISDRANKVVGCGIHVKPDGLMLTNIPNEHIEGVFESVDESVGMPHRILAQPRVAEQLARYWETIHGADSYCDTSWHVFRVDELRSPKSNTKGRLRRGDSEDKSWVAEWGTEYGKERPAPLDVAEFMTRKLHDGDLYIWEDSEPKMMITVSGRFGHGVRISAAFTPLEYRGNGYASAAVFELTKQHLENGCEFVTLVARKGDPVERLYERLGYYVIGDRVSITMNANAR